MSWLVETLLLTREDIRANRPIDSEEYLSLLAVENKIEELKDANILDAEELDIINKVLEGGSYTSLGEKLNIARSTVAKKFKNACYKISFALGGEFTDEGLIQSMSKKYNLSEDQCQKLREYMQGNLRHKLRRKIDE